MLTVESIQQALRTVKYPGYSRDIVAFGLVKDIAVTEDRVALALQFTTQKSEVIQAIAAACDQALRAVPGVRTVAIDTGAAAASPAAAAIPNPDPWANQKRIPGVRRVVAVASGKGGVGKSTVAVNLACALARLGDRVGLLDCDIYGPSIPLMMGLQRRPDVTAEEKLEPPANHGVKLMSIGFFLDGDTPVIWRGPMIKKTIDQFLESVDWGELDWLLVDLPPGTGDAQLSLCQAVPLDGGLVVTTPQEASLGVVRKGMGMFQKLNVPILGLVENMSYFTAPGGERVEIFGHGGGRAEAERQTVPFLGEVPLFTEIRLGGDQGQPVVVSAPDTPPAQVFLNLARTLRQRLT